MATSPKYSLAEMQSAYLLAGKNAEKASAAIGCSPATLRRYLKESGIDTSDRGKRVTSPESPSIKLPEFPDDDIPVSEMRDLLARRFEKRQTHHKAKQWYPIKVKTDGPIGVTFWGDPHLDDNGCNWPMLNRHCDIHRANNALFSVNIGDHINNWADRLMKLYANQDTSSKTAQKLAEWFLHDSGIRWLTILFGNHDLWTAFPEVLRAQNTAKVPMEDWQARFRLVFSNGREAKIWASHDFSGNSMWNSLHGPQKAAHTKAEADIYACGHTHNWAIHQEESASRNFTYWLIRSRGYKFLDSYAEELGHFSQEEGASITCVIDPESTSMAGYIQAFADMEHATDYLKWARK